MTTRQVLNRNSYVLGSALVLMLAAYFVAQLDTWPAWIAWILAVVLLYAGFLALRPGPGTTLSVEEVERLIGGGKPVMLELFSNYSLLCMAAKPVIAAIEKQLEGRVRIIRVDVGTENGRKIASRVGLDIVPTFIGFEAGGVERWRIQRIPNRYELWRRLVNL